MKDFWLRRSLRRLRWSGRRGLRLGCRGRSRCGRGAALHPCCDRFSAERYVLFFPRIEKRKELRRYFVFALVCAQDRFECLRSADADIVVLLEIGRGWILVPSFFIFQGWCRHPVKITAAGNCCCHGDWVT